MTGAESLDGRETMAMTGRQKKLLVLSVVFTVEVVSTALAWRDLASRGEAEVRGSKRFWRGFVLVNPGNSLLYWLIGRR
jgi:hypothetical protein